MPTHILRRLRLIAPLVLVVLLVPLSVHAQAGGGLPINTTYTTISQWALMIVQFLNIMTWFVFSFLIKLLDPRFIFDPGLMNVLNEVWQLSRNLMNVAFAVLLVGAAIYTVVRADKEFINQHLKNFVIAVIFVNFSWFAPRVALDVANIATATIFSIPSAMVDASAQCSYVSSKREGCLNADPRPDNESFNCSCKAVADFEPFPGSDRARDLEGRAGLAWECSWAYCIRFVPLNPATSTNEGAILNGLIVNHARLPQLSIITRVQRDDDVSDLLLFILRELVIIVIHIALFFPLLALLVALVIRIPVLWLSMALMPFYFLSMVIPDELHLGMVTEKAKTILSMFLKAAFLPAAVAVPLSVGFIMANAGSRLTQVAGLEQMKFNLIDGMGSFAQVLWLIMVLGVLWTGTFEVLEAMTKDMPGGGAINKIKETGSQAGKFAAELPLSTVPLPGVGGNALGALKMFGPRGIQNARSDIAAGGIKALGKGGAPIREGNRLKEAAKGLSDDGRTSFNAGVEHFKNNNDISKLQEFFKTNLKNTGIKLDDTNFKQHVLTFATELEKVGKSVSSMSAGINRDTFISKADAKAKAKTPPANP